VTSLELEIAATAAALIVEEGLEYGVAKKKALKQMGLPPRTALPSSELVHEQVMDYVGLYCADTQPQELKALRELAHTWMQRLQSLQDGLRVYIEGAVWLGSATRLSDIRLLVFSPECKTFEMALLNQGIAYEAAPPRSDENHKTESSHIYLQTKCNQLNEIIGIHVMIHDLNDERRLRAPLNQGVVWRGDATDLATLLQA
jgi:hypothetical protein